jgi:hypothetical protein
MHFKNRLLVTSLALAAAGILTCVACLLDVLFPRGTLLAFLGWMAAAGVAIAAIMISFAWSCEKVDDHNRAPRQKAEHDSNDWPRAVAIAPGGRPAVLFDRVSRPGEPPPMRRLQGFPATLRSAIPPTSFRSSRIGRGQ